MPITLRSLGVYVYVRSRASVVLSEGPGGTDCRNSRPPPLLRRWRLGTQKAKRSQDSDCASWLGAEHGAPGTNRSTQLAVRTVGPVVDDTESGR